MTKGRELALRSIAVGTAVDVGFYSTLNALRFPNQPFMPHALSQLNGTLPEGIIEAGLIGIPALTVISEGSIASKVGAASGLAFDAGFYITTRFLESQAAHTNFAFQSLSQTFPGTEGIAEVGLIAMPLILAGASELMFGKSGKRKANRRTTR